MSVMSDIATTVNVAFCGRSPEPLFKADSLNELRKQYEAQDGETHWFDAETLDFFGSENLHMFRPGITIERQTNAPENVPQYRVTAWVVYSDSDRIVPVSISAFHTLDEAQAFTDVIYNGWSSL